MRTMGRLLEIWIAPEAGAGMVQRGHVQAIPGNGLEGDRYCDGGTWSDRGQSCDREVTLIEIEQLAWYEQEHGVPFPPGQTRRNLLTQGVSLGELIGRHFHVGDVELEGMRLCQPCAYLQEKTGFKVLPSMVDRSGLNCRILVGGLLRTGDAITISTDD